jgi:hypothetical protein
MTFHRTKIITASIELSTLMLSSSRHEEGFLLIVLFSFFRIWRMCQRSIKSLSVNSTWKEHIVSSEQYSSKIWAKGKTLLDDTRPPSFLTT